MTNQRNLLITLAVSAVAIPAVLVLASWNFKQPTPFINVQQNTTDTIPKKEKKIHDLDDVIDELNEADLKVDMEKIKKEIAETMKNIDDDKISMEVEKAIKDVDIKKIQQEVSASIAKIDWKKMQAEINQEMKNVDFQKIQKEVDASIAKIDRDKMKAEIDKVKNIDLKTEEKLSKIGSEIQKSIEKAKTEMKEYNEFVDSLEKDGLLNRKEGYTIKHKEGDLIVNDKKVSESVYKKYKRFPEKHKKFKIEKSDDNFNIEND